MTESFWTKKLIDGSSELGSDSLIEARKASWTRGRQDIEEVTLFFAGQKIVFRCPSFGGLCAEWKQTDQNIFSTIQGKTFRCARQVKCRPLSSRHFGVASGSNCSWIIVGEEGPCLLPEGKEWICCTIKSDGSIMVGWE
jgi:hypothetical protein